MAAHLLGLSEATPKWVHVITTGYPSALFAVLGGFGVVFASRKYSGWAATAGIAVRGLVVVLIGWLLELLPDHNIAVVLVYFGTAIVVASLFVRAPTWLIGIAAAVLAIVGSQTIPWFRREVYVGNWEGMLDYDSPSRFFQSLFFTGTYPVLTWVVYLLIGMVLARWVLAWRANGRLLEVGTWLLIGGAIVASAAWIFSEAFLRRVYAPLLVEQNGVLFSDVIEYFRTSQYGSPPLWGWPAVFIASPHSGSLMDIVHAASVAAAVIGLCVLCTAWMKKVPIWLAPLTAAGAAPLTIYVLHICMTAFMYAGAGPLVVAPNPVIDSAFWWQLAVVLAVGIGLAAFKKRGPLEYVTSQAAKVTATSMTAKSTGMTS